MSGGGGGSGNDSGGGSGVGRQDAESQYGADSVGSYDSSQNQSGREQSYGGGNDNTVDPGFQKALKEQAKKQADPVYGDPDPQVDVDPRDRDSITSFKDNYIANVKSNPMYLGIGGLLHTAYQTGKAKSMLSGVPGYEFLDYSDGNNNVPTIAGGGGENTTALLAASPYLVSGDTQVESEASKWYNNIGNDTKQFNFASAYATAKEKVSQTLNNKGPIGMLAVSDSPYYDWLKTNKLDRGIL
jgi:hypothetical protein